MTTHLLQGTQCPTLQMEACWFEPHSRHCVVSLSKPLHMTDFLLGHKASTQTHLLHRGSYMSAHVLLNLLNELGKRDKMRGLPSILSLFRNEFNKFNNTRARMLDSIYHMTNTLKSHFLA